MKYHLAIAYPFTKVEDMKRRDALIRSRLNIDRDDGGVGATWAGGSSVDCEPYRELVLKLSEGETLGAVNRLLAMIRDDEIPALKFKVEAQTQPTESE